MIDNFIFLSNSVPKSGSSLLFNFQRDVLLSIFGRSSCDYTILQKAGIPIENGFLPPIAVPNFLELMNSAKFNGPLIIKVHTPVFQKLKKRYEADENFFMSLIVRDPLDTLISAKENYRLTGEFSEFESLESGCDMVNGFFQSIYDTVVNCSRKPVPIVHYSMLLENPVDTVFRSFSPALISRIARRALGHHLDVNSSRKKAAHRLQRGGLKRDITDLPIDKQDYVLQSLHDFRAKLGYVSV